MFFLSLFCKSLLAFYGTLLFNALVFIANAGKGAVKAHERGVSGQSHFCYMASSIWSIVTVTRSKPLNREAGKVDTDHGITRALRLKVTRHWPQPVLAYTHSNTQSFILLPDQSPASIHSAWTHYTRICMIYFVSCNIYLVLCSPCVYKHIYCRIFTLNHNFYAL